VGTTREKTGIEPKERKEGAGERNDRVHVEWMRQNETEREGKERGEIQNVERREIGWMKEIWKRKDRMEKERNGV
jgi:hypothetical protein